MVLSTFVFLWVGVSFGDDEKSQASAGAVYTAPAGDSDAKASDAEQPGQQPGNARSPAEGPNKSGAQPPKDGEQPGKPEGPGGKPAGASGKPGDAPKPDEPKPTLRPTTPAKPPNPDELKVRPDADGKVRFSFQGQPWEPVLKWLADISGMSLDWQKLPGDFLNLSTKQRYTVRETRDLINQHLLARGYTLLCNGEVLTVANIKELDPSLVPRVTPEELDQRDPHEFVKVTFALDWMTAESLIEEITPMKSPNGKLTPLKSTNRLEALDAVINLREIRALLNEVQSADNQQRLVKEFVLQYARASDVIEQLHTLLGPDAKGEAMPGMPGEQNPQGGDNPQQQQAMMIARMQQQQQQQQQGGQGGPQGHAKPKQLVMLVLNQRRNSILANAPPDKMAIIAQAISAIDVPLDSNQSLLTNVSRMQVYRITGIDPEPVVKTLQEIGNLDPTTRLQIDKKNKAIVAYATLADHVTIRSVVEKLSGSERRFEVVRLRRLPADYVAGSIMFMMAGEKKEKPVRQPYWMMDYGNQSNADKDKSNNEFRVEADVDHNRLLLWANEIELGEVENLLVKLGEIPPKGSRRDTVRVIDVRDGREGQELLEKIRRAWPTVAPNPLLVNPAPAEEKTPSKPLKEQLSPPEPATKSAISPRPAPTEGWSGDGSQVRAEAAEPVKFGDSGPDKSLPGKSKLDSLHLVQFAREDSPPPPARESSLKSPAPVEIKVDAEGRLIVSSEDTEALDSIEELAAQLAPPRRSYKVFKLKYAWAYGVALNLEDFFKDEEKKESRGNFWDYYYGGNQDDKEDKSNRLSKRRPLKFISDSESNTILVENADAAQLKTIAELIELYDKQPDDSQSVRKTETIHLDYSKAKVVAETVKDVYRDLLSANDKALQGAKGNDRDSSRTFIYEFSGDEDGKKDQKMPKFKGQLSIGVDDLSNSLVISAPAYLFEQVHKMIRDLDMAAAPTSTIKVVKLGQGVTSQQAREALSDILGGSASKEKSSSESSKKAESNNKQPSKGKNNKSSGNSSSK